MERDSFKMVQPYIYQFEFVVDDLNIWNLPIGIYECDDTCVDFAFQSNVHVSIGEVDFGSTLDASNFKNGKNCLFTLDRVLQENDKVSGNKLHYHLVCLIYCPINR